MKREDFYMRFTLILLMALSFSAHGFEFRIPFTNTAIVFDSSAAHDSSRGDSYPSGMKAKYSSLRKSLDCYSKLLGINPPRLVLENTRLLRTRSGKAIASYHSGANLIKASASADAHAMAHEARHGYQNKTGALRNYAWRTPYGSRPLEIEADRWANQNSSKCQSGRAVTSKPVSNSSKHRVVRGDTWWKLARSYAGNANKKKWIVKMIRKNGSDDLTLGKSVKVK